MKELQYSYVMHLQFEKPVWDHSFTLRCTPSSTRRQKIQKSAVRILPECDVSEGFDGFGNPTITGSIPGWSEYFSAVSEGTVLVEDTEFEEEADPAGTGIFRYPTELTRPGEQLQQFFAGHPEWSSPSRDTALSILHAVHAKLQYAPHSTDIFTGAEEAFCSGSGVCQDYAHVMIALCRLAGIPARYVVGVLEGEGKSHAWCEVCIDHRWYGMDPTNDVCVSEHHVRFSAGRDYNDCRINRGIFRGSSAQKQEIHVEVKEDNQ